VMEYDNTNRGSIWKNDKMREGKQDPEFTGSLNVDGVEYWVKAWKRKEGASARAPALSFKVEPKEDKRSAPAPARIARPSSADMDDEIPF
jgi:hypothetical protein